MADISFPNVSVTSYVAGGSSLTIAQLLASYPPSVSTVGLYARVSNLYGSVDDIMRCRFDGTNYNWVPQRDSFAGNATTSSGTITLIPLTTPPTLRLTTSTLTANVTVTPSALNAYAGQRFRVIVNPAINLGLYTAAITGLLGTNITLLAGSMKDIEFGAGGWFQSS